MRRSVVHIPPSMLNFQLEYRGIKDSTGRFRALCTYM